MLASEKNLEWDCIIIGAGILGTAIAYSLSKNNRRILLIERDWSMPDRIVGELLQPGGIKALKEMGLEKCIENIDGISVHGYCIFHKERQAMLPYPGKEQGISFHHGKFVMNLREACKTVELIHCLQGTASSLIYSGERVVGVKLTTQEEYYAPLTIVADGCFSKFRKEISPNQIRTSSSFVALLLTNCPLPKPNHGHVVLCQPAPVLLYQIGTEDTRVLIDIPGKLPSSVDGSLQKYLVDVVSPQLPEQVQQCFLDAVSNQKPRSMPNSFLAPYKNKKAGVLLLGDAMNMRHPLTGGGMTVALWDAVHVSELLCDIDLNDIKKTMSCLSKLHWKRKKLSVINILAHGLYSLFSAGNAELQVACFKYLKLGGIYTNTPIALLGGLLPSPVALVMHFFMVAFYSIYLYLGKFSMWQIPFQLGIAFMILLRASQVIFPVLWSEII